MRHLAFTGGLVAALAAPTLAPSIASAADTWTTPHPGVRMLRRTTPTPWRISALEIDLCRDGVSLRATKSGERQRTVSSFGQLVGAEAAVNGDFFSYADYSTTGLAIGAGERWPGSSDGGGTGFLAFGLGRAELSRPGAVVDPPPAWMRNVVSGRTPLVRDGVAMAEDGSEFCTTRHPRTAAGMSRDGRTLILAVVDGRSTSSVGMRCTETGALLRELGAWEAINLDGGGSSAMWVRGTGVVNTPSDGSQRVVANHLGVLASGAGEPGSCDRSREEAVLHGEVASASTTTDIDGDGDADLCARGAAGVVCYPAEGGAFGERIDGPALSDEAGWDAANRWATIRMGDVDGDGDADLCARDAGGMRCFLSDGSGFPDEIPGPPMADENGWDDPMYFGTVRMADVDGDGLDDVCARAAAGFMCWRSTGAGFADAFTLADLGNDAGGGAMNVYGTIRMGDVDGDARDDVCARTADGVRCWRSDGDGFGPAIEGPEWSNATGWGRVPYWSTFRLVDVDGDRRADVCARAAAGLRCHLSTGDGFGPAVEAAAWSDASGWGDYANYSTIRFGDLDGDGDRDVCARADSGVVCHPWEGAGFGAAIDGPTLSDASGWGSIRFFSSMRFQDVDGDGAEEICARGSTGIRCWSGADGFATSVSGPAWSDEVGWNAPRYYETIRGVTPRSRCLVEEVCGNDVDDDCDGDVDEGCGSSSAGGGEDASGAGPGAGGASGSGGATSSPTAGPGPSGAGGVGADGDAASGDADGGCACRAAPVRPSSPAMIAALAVATAVVARRRRR